MAPDWKQYQEDAAQFFRSIGLEAETDATIQGARASHDIDVVVRSHHVGFDLLWIVECKQLQRRVTKLHVLALREIISDVGADRGIILSESGFQSGAIAAANLTNVQLTSISELRMSASDAIAMAELRELAERTRECHVRYWSLDKEFRIDHDLRPPVGMGGYSSTQVMDAINFALDAAFRGEFPVQYRDAPLTVIASRIRFHATSLIDLAREIEVALTDLEGRLDAADEAKKDDGG